MFDEEKLGEKIIITVFLIFTMISGYVVLNHEFQTALLSLLPFLVPYRTEFFNVMTIVIFMVPMWAIVDLKFRNAKGESSLFEKTGLVTRWVLMVGFYLLIAYGIYGWIEMTFFVVGKGVAAVVGH